MKGNRMSNKDDLIQPAVAQAKEGNRSQAKKEKGRDILPDSRFTKKCPYCGALLTLDAKICWSCGKGLVSHRSKQATKSAFPHSSCLILIVVVCMIVIVSLLPSEEDETENSHPLIGETGMIYNGSGRIMVARDFVTFDELMKGSDPNGADKMAEMLNNGRAFWVGSNTLVKVTQKYGAGMEVLILSGEMSGRRCWLPSGWVVVEP
jgi:hypothetical protein